jgi:hypothetical protein
MCIGGTPDVPSVPERQAERSPDNGDPTRRSNERQRRRMAFASSILTAPGGTLGQPTTTATPAKPVLG